MATGRTGAVLDVTDPEPLPPDSRLLDLPDAFLTPHPTGSLGNELERLGRAVAGEAEQLVPGPHLARPLPEEELSHSGRPAVSLPGHPGHAALSVVRSTVAPLIEKPAAARAVRV
ncbi:NAD(P)-dependent oxidoreductase [Streptomyces sp. NPDC056308]|uniref:NAD(P)-dependent oxidoreductase n=1 Tax=Streptomyces sp. NPDC056308 TaxID=3345780 RepID=UPI0035D8866F